MIGKIISNSYVLLSIVRFRKKHFTGIFSWMYILKRLPLSHQKYGRHQDGLMVTVSASHGFASRPGHTKDHHNNGKNCLPALHAYVR